MCDLRHQIPDILDRKSVFLLGPRQTGKSSYLRQRFPEAQYVDLLEADTFRELSSFPETMRQSLLPSDKLVVIDETQKLPSLLDEVQTANLSLLPYPLCLVIAV